MTKNWLAVTLHLFLNAHTPTPTVSHTLTCTGTYKWYAHTHCRNIEIQLKEKLEESAVTELKLATGRITHPACILPRCMCWHELFSLLRGGSVQRRLDRKLWHLSLYFISSWLCLYNPRAKCEKRSQQWKQASHRWHRMKKKIAFRLLLTEQTLFINTYCILLQLSAFRVCYSGQCGTMEKGYVQKKNSLWTQWSINSNNAAFIGKKRQRPDCFIWVSVGVIAKKPFWLGLFVA